MIISNKIILEFLRWFDYSVPQSAFERLNVHSSHNNHFMRGFNIEENHSSLLKIMEYNWFFIPIRSKRLFS